MSVRTKKEEQQFSDIRMIRLIQKGWVSLRTEGVVHTWRKTVAVLTSFNNYRKWLRSPLFSQKELDDQRRNVFPKQILFSIIVPLFNTPQAFLVDMIESVQNQTYVNWELCMADGSDPSHPEVGHICREYAQKDKRIRYLKLEENLGIAENTNQALHMANGEYIALLDHDDVLHPAALFEVMRQICKHDADFIYTDENVFLSPKLKRSTGIHFKPDFAPDNLRANNYICHFTVFKRDLLRQSGEFRSGFDGSQDHDLVLRLTAVAKNIRHIPEVLYYWRAHPNSVAMGISAKEYALVAGQKAVQSSLNACGLSGKVEYSLETPSIYRIRYDLKEHPVISIVIVNQDHAAELKRCIESIQTSSTYHNFEVVIIDQHSTQEETDRFYKEAERTWKNVHVCRYDDLTGRAELINRAIRETVRGEYILLLSSSTEVIEPSWMEELLMYAQREDVGAVGGLLVDRKNRVIHAGLVFDSDGTVAYAFHGTNRQESTGYLGRLSYAQNLSLIDAQCMLVRRTVWDEIGGFDEAYRENCMDLDLCMQVRSHGLLIVWTPFAQLCQHDERQGMNRLLWSKGNTKADLKRFRDKWKQVLEAGDPYYNPNFSLKAGSFLLKNRRQHAQKEK